MLSNVSTSVDCTEIQPNLDSADFKYSFYPEVADALGSLEFFFGFLYKIN